MTGSNKTPLILLPGTLCDQTLWHHQLDHLADIAEMSVGDLTQHDSVAKMARSVLRSAPERFALAGLSLGGIVAFEIMRQAPERVTKLALLDTNPRPIRPTQIPIWQSYVRLATNGQFGDITARHLLPGLIHPDRQQDKSLTTAIEQMADNIGPEAFVRQARAVTTRPDSRPGLPHIACPTLVVVGRQDALCSLDLHEEIAGAIPKATLVIVEQCGHLSSLERPQAVTALLRYWLLMNCLNR